MSTNAIVAALFVRTRLVRQPNDSPQFPSGQPGALCSAAQARAAEQFESVADGRLGAKHLLGLGAVNSGISEVITPDHNYPQERSKFVVCGGGSRSTFPAGSDHFNNGRQSIAFRAIDRRSQQRKFSWV